MIRTIIFDLGNVLIPFDWRRGYAALARYSPLSPEEVRARIKENRLFDAFERGHIEPREFARILNGLLSLDGVDFESFQKIWSSIFLPETLVPEALVESLHARYRLLLLSNTDPIHYGWVRHNYAIMRHFDDAVLSFEVGSRKPEREIYEEAIRKAACLPSEIFFTDDKEKNVQGARALGIEAVLFESASQLEAALRERGIQW